MHLEISCSKYTSVTHWVTHFSIVALCHGVKAGLLGVLKIQSIEHGSNVNEASRNTRKTNIESCKGICTMLSDSTSFRR